MNALIENLNLWGERLLDFASPMLLQSSALIAVLFALDFALRRKVRAVVRYTLWLVVLVKLLLPPTFALPTSVAWWMRTSPPAAKSEARTFIVTYGNATTPVALVIELPQPLVFRPTLSLTGGAVVVLAVITFGLLAWMLLRWRHVARVVCGASPATEALTELLNEAKRGIGLRRSVRLRLTDLRMSPAVCGLFRPVILLPRALADQLPPNQLRAVLLHELVHLKHGDVWVNFVQALLQITYWWHPLLWLANARIRLVREEAVDDAVMLALSDEAESYAPTLLEVAKLAFNRPLAALGLVGIMESRTSLRQRIERLMEFRPPRRVGLTLASVFGVLAFTVLAVPMGQPPKKAPEALATSPWPDPRFEGYVDIELEPLFFMVPGSTLNGVTLLNGAAQGPLVVSSNEVAELKTTLREVGARNFCDAEPLGFRKCSGLRCQMLIGGCANNSVDYQTKSVSGSNFVTGARVELMATEHDWMPLGFTFVPWNEGDGSVRCQLELTPENQTNAAQRAEVLIPPGGAVLWGVANHRNPGLFQFVMLEDKRGAGWETSAHPLVQDGRLLLELGKLEEAQTKLNKAISLDPENKAARYYLSVAEKSALAESNRMADSKRQPAPLAFARKAELGLASETSTPTNATSQGLFDAFPKSLYENPPRTRVSFSHPFDLRYTVELREDGSYWVEDKRKTLADLRHWLSFIVMRPAAANVGLQVSTNAPAESKRALNELFKEAGVGEYYKPPPTNLVVCAYKVDPSIFISAFERVGSVPVNRTNDGTSVRDIVTLLGVDLSPPKSLFWNDRIGTLMVRATKHDLDKIESAIQVLNVTPPQVNIKVRFVEVPTKEVGRVLGMFLPDAPVTGTNGFTGILTKPQADKLMKTLESTKGADVLSAPQVTTLSGRQAQIQNVDLQTIVTGVTPVFTNGVTNLVPQTQTVPFGPVLDVIPHVFADGYTIQMTVIPNMTEFLGYDAASNAIKAASRGRLRLDKGALPLPRFRIRQITTTAVVWDGQTIVLGNFPDKELTKLPNGQEAIKDVSSASKKQLLVFVTPTLIDPAGNLMHAEEELPFARERVPPQTRR